MQIGKATNGETVGGESGEEEDWSRGVMEGGNGCEMKTYQERSIGRTLERHSRLGRIGMRTTSAES